MSGLRIEGLERLSRKLKELPKEATDVVLDALSAGAEQIRADAQAKAPVGVSGGLSRDIITNQLKDGRQGVSVSVNSAYGGYVEFGTGKKVNKGLIAKYPAQAQAVKNLPSTGTFKQFVESLSEWVRRKGITGNARGKQNDSDRQIAYGLAFHIIRNGIKSQPYFFPAWEQNEKRILNNAKKALSTYIKNRL